MAVPETTASHYARQQRLTAAVIAAARTTWSLLDPDAIHRLWPTVHRRLVLLTVTAQRAAASDAIRYLPLVLDELDIDAPAAGTIDGRRLTGVSSDGRPLSSLLESPLVRARETLGDRDALSAGLHSLERILATQLADIARTAVGTGIASRPAVTGYTRMLNAPSCSRCALLAGKWYRWNQGFMRHPRCDCRHIPATAKVAGDLTTDPRSAIAAGQVTGLSSGDRRAIEDGADLGRVINARRGMSTTSTTTRARSPSGRRRLMPEEIYTSTTDRMQAIALLRHHGYPRLNPGA